MKSFLAKIYAYSFLDNFILLFTVYSLLFRDTGLTPLQIGILFGILPVITFIFEVPTGVLADKYQRRTLLCIAQLLKAAGFALWFMFRNYESFAIGFALWGFSMTLVSGTFESYVYDELKQFNREKEYGRVVGKISAAHFLGLTFATLLGGFLAELGYDVVLIPSIVVPLIAAVLIFTTRAVHAERSTGERKYWHILKEAFGETRGNLHLLSIMAYFAIAFGVIHGSDEFWVLYFGERGVTIALIGVILAVANGVTTVAGLTAHFWLQHERFAYLLMTFAGLAAIAATLCSVPAAVVLAITFCYFSQVAVIQCETRLQHAISSHQRATVTSIKSLLTQATTFAFFIAVGFLAEIHGYASFFWIVGGTLSVVSVAYLTFYQLKHVLFDKTASSA